MIRFITLLNASYHNWIAQIRAFFFRPFFKHIGKYVLFREGFKFQSAKQISIGHHVFINHGVEIAGAGGVKIGNYILIGPNVLIVTTIHQTVDTAVPMFTQTFGGNDKYKPVTIEDDVWIGAKAVILPGIHIGKGAASFLLKNILLHEKKLDIGNGIEPSGHLPKT
jgi:maltose O-acetyltransferase